MFSDGFLYARAGKKIPLRLAGQKRYEKQVVR